MKNNLEIEIEYEVRNKDGKIVRKGTIDPAEIKRKEHNKKDNNLVR